MFVPYDRRIPSPPPIFMAAQTSVVFVSSSHADEWCCAVHPAGKAAPVIEWERSLAMIVPDTLRAQEGSTEERAIVHSDPSNQELGKGERAANHHTILRLQDGESAAARFFVKSESDAASGT
jgi:hypothetical protein